MNIFRLAGDMTHLASVLVLLLKIHTIKSCAEATKSGEWLDKGGDWNGEGRCGEWRECPDLRNTKKLMDWAKNTAEKAQLLAACFAAVTAHKLESAQPQNNHDKESGHHWPQDAAEIRDRTKILFYLHHHDLTSQSRLRK
uniref:Pectinesterase inhibitor domain-containing protein n=1 Tax=Fagus sylvatica TaxID=28930 RepID=A0A2N9IFT7_FAGSY